MKKTMNCLFIPLLLLCGSGCEKNEGGGPNEGPGRVSPPDGLVYTQTVTPPTIPAVDENSGYTAYYVDSAEGNDANDGLSEQTPFKTLSKISGLAKSAGMKVLLKKGGTFTGAFTLKELNATEQKPFIVDSYGTGERPVVDGNGADQAVYIQDGNIRFRNIHITNKRGKRGIYIVPLSTGATKNIEVAGCRLEEINWAGDAPLTDTPPNAQGVAAIDASYNKEFGGIVMKSAETKTSPAWMENVYITGNELHKVSRTGIFLINRWGTRIQGEGYNEVTQGDQSWYPCRNVVIQGNDLSYIGGDGAVLWGCDASFIDHNKCYYANWLGRTGQANAGLWPYTSRNVVMQYNEVAYTQLPNGSADGEGMDVDIACKGTVIQYNYLHHNLGGGILMCNNGRGDHSGTTIRNNVFLENGGRDQYKGSMLVITSDVGSTGVYNNTVITNSVNARLLQSSDWFQAGKGRDITFRNNIFMSTSGAVGIINRSNIDNCLFENNLYWNLGSFYGLENRARFYDPGIVVPEDPDGYDKALMMKASDPDTYLDGIFFDGMLDTDIAGNPAIDKGYLGAFAE